MYNDRPMTAQALLRRACGEVFLSSAAGFDGEYARSDVARALNISEAGRGQQACGARCPSIHEASGKYVGEGVFMMMSLRSTNEFADRLRRRVAAALWWSFRHRGL